MAETPTAPEAEALAAAAPLAAVAPVAAMASIVTAAAASTGHEASSTAPHSTQPEHWNAAIGPIVLVIFIAIIVIAYLWANAGYPLP